MIVSKWRYTDEPGDLISRADAIEALVQDSQSDGAFGYVDTKSIIDILSALPSAELTVQTPQTYGKSINPSNGEVVADYISRADAIEAVAQQWLLEASAESPYVNDDDIGEYRKLAEELFEDVPSADAVHGWRIGKPTEQGKYMVTIDSFGHKRIDLFYYGKPLMPNRKVRGKCWYRSDDEWGDVVYDNKDILAWQPLPKPYTKGDNE